MIGVLLIGVLFTVLCRTAAGAASPHSCEDIYLWDVTSQSGVYMINNRHNGSYQVYCEFHKGYGYTFIDPATTVPVNINDLYTDNTQVLIRDLRKDGTQYEATIQQIAAFESVPLSIQYNDHVGYSPITNPTMTPYIYLGFLPVAKIYQGQREGYRMNGKDLAFTNCDGNGNNYFAFLFNQNNSVPTAYGPVYSSLQHDWADMATALPHSKFLPNNYFSFFEVHFGGCGAYGTPQHLPNITGAALGLRYETSCHQPVDIAHASKEVTGTSTGSTVTYMCDLGYVREYGDMKRSCSERGVWTGSTPSCKALPCSSNPCQNGGVCSEVGGTLFVCKCPGHFRGQFCEQWCCL